MSLGTPGTGTASGASSGARSQVGLTHAAGDDPSTGVVAAGGDAVVEEEQAASRAITAVAAVITMAVRPGRRVWFIAASPAGRTASRRSLDSHRRT